MKHISTINRWPIKLVEGLPAMNTFSEFLVFTLPVLIGQGIVYLNRNGTSATFLAHVCNAKKIKELFYHT